MGDEHMLRTLCVIVVSSAVSALVTLAHASAKRDDPDLRLWSGANDIRSTLQACEKVMRAVPGVLHIDSFKTQS